MVIFYFVRPLSFSVLHSARVVVLWLLNEEGVGVQVEGLALFLEFFKYFGFTVQVAGLTNNSYEEGAVMIRKCISLYPRLGYQVLDVAKVRF